MTAKPARGRRLPTGTVTFLFTDIEGSTRLLSDLGDQYADVLDAHNEILRVAVAANRGVELGTEGDAFFGVFESAVDAVAAVTGAQRALAERRWPANAEIRVRMGLHAGEGRLGGDNYVGLDVHLAARIAAAGHGGQVLLSDATRSLTAGGLPAGVALRDLGRHLLKDFPAPEQLWQLDIEGLPADFPALRSRDAPRGNLPEGLSPLLGRETEIASVVDLLDRHRLVTLLGPGGTGKTRLALAVAEAAGPRFGDGAYLARLEDAFQRPEVASAIASALGVRERADRDLEGSVGGFLASREILLVLDNFEQVVHAAPFVSDLLDASSGLRVLATSRTPLNVSAEQARSVPPLGLPDGGVSRPTAADILECSAVALFVDRARAVRPDFQVTDDNAPAVAELCRRLDGLPLAIELAAARVRLLPPEAILRRLDQRLPALGAGPQDRPARQRTLDGLVDWSHQLLGPPERSLFARLAVFAGGWTIEAAEAVANPNGALGVDTLDGLEVLVDNSLIQAASTDDGEPRFSMLQVIREFAIGRLEAEADGDDVRRRHAAFFADLAAAAEPELLRADLRRWQRRLHLEEDNLRAALRWAIDRGNAAIGLQLAGSLWRYWHYWARQREGRTWLEAVLGLAADEATATHRANAVSGLAAILYWQGDPVRAGELYAEALALRLPEADDATIARSLYDMAWAAAARGDAGAATAFAHDALQRYRQADDAAGVANVTGWLVASPFLLHQAPDLEAALRATVEAIETNRRLGLLHDAADWMATGALIRSMAKLPDAIPAAQESLRTWHELGNAGRMGFLKLLAMHEVNRGNLARGATLAAAAERLKDQVGGELPGQFLGISDPIEDARAALDEATFARAVELGRQMTLDAAVAFALEETNTV